MNELQLPVRGETDLAVAISQASRALDAVHAPEEEKVRVLTAVTELSRNIVKYAGQGKVRFGCSRVGARVLCWVIAEDDGPGIADVHRALEDHFSTGNTLGLGLPGVRRLMDRMEIDSSPCKGTRIRAERSFVA